MPCASHSRRCANSRRSRRWLRSASLMRQTPSTARPRRCPTGGRTLTPRIVATAVCEVAPGVGEERDRRDNAQGGAGAPLCRSRAHAAILRRGREGPLVFLLHGFPIPHRGDVLVEERGGWGDGALEVLKADCEVRVVRPAGLEVDSEDQSCPLSIPVESFS